MAHHTNDELNERKVHKPSLGLRVIPAMLFCAAIAMLIASAPPSFFSYTHSRTLAFGTQGPSFVPTCTMGADRFGHAAVLLPNGKVLIIGGYQWRVPPDAPLNRATCELFDPATGGFAAASAMNVSYTEPKAHLLPNGKVIVSGRPGALELYDPIRDRFTLTSLSVPPTTATAALADGKVLFYGATCQSCTPLNCYLYDPIAHNLITGDSIGAGRSNATATLLPNGNVLVIGGYTYNFNSGVYTQTYLSSAELIDPETGAVTPTGSMNFPRAYHTATILPNGKVLIVGGSALGPLPTSAEIYDPVTGAFSPTSGRLNFSRFLHTATPLPNGNVLIAGGDIGDGNPTATNCMIPQRTGLPSQALWPQAAHTTPLPCYLMAVYSWQVATHEMETTGQVL